MRRADGYRGKKPRGGLTAGQVAASVEKAIRSARESQ